MCMRNKNLHVGGIGRHADELHDKTVISVLNTCPVEPVEVCSAYMYVLYMV